MKRTPLFSILLIIITVSLSFSSIFPLFAEEALPEESVILNEESAGEAAFSEAETIEDSPAAPETSFADEMIVTVDEVTADETAVPVDEVTSEEAMEDKTAEEPASADEITDDETAFPVEEIAAAKEVTAVEETTPVNEEPVPVEEDVPAEESLQEETPEEPASTEEVTTPAEKPASPEEPASTEEPTTSAEEPASTEEVTTTPEEPTPAEEPTTPAEEPTPTEEATTPAEEPTPAEDDELSLFEEEIKAEETVKNGFVQVDGVWGWYKNNKLQKSMTGIIKGTINGRRAWFYVRRGVYTPATGIAKRADKANSTWYYVKDGVYTRQTLFANRASGAVNKNYYVRNGIMRKVTGIVKAPLNGVKRWYFIKKGVYTENTGIAKKAIRPTDTLYYVENGKFTRRFTGLTFNARTSDSIKLYYVKKGKFDSSFNGTLDYHGSKLLVKNGKTERTSYPLSPNAVEFFDGLDISSWQGEIDFVKVAKAGIKYIIPREGYWTKRDPMFLNYVKGAMDNGIAVPGVYHFIYATNAREARKEARKCIASVQKAGLPMTTVLWADLEYDTVDTALRDGIVLTAEDQTKIVREFCRTIEKEGYPTGIYTNQDYAFNIFDQDLMSAYDIWLADYEGEAAIDCVYRQTGFGHVDGINGQVDTNVFVGRYASYLNN